MKKIIEFFKDKKIAILGFGREGKSSFRFIRNHFPDKHLAIHDLNEIEIKDSNVLVITGDNYLQNLNDYEIILKTPGISFANLNYFIEPEKICSQTSLFLQYYGKQTIGITGTKGKSTTVSLINHILNLNHKKTITAGNIGVPFFDILEQIDTKTIVVAELSAHQLEFVHHAPYIAVLLNLYQEHLDHFNSFSSYMQAKLNITKYQNENDFLVYNEDDEWITKQITQNNYKRVFEPFSNRIQNHAAITTCRLFGISDEKIETAFASFIPLEHRQEFVGEKQGICFYNDSIATVPEATIFALERLKNVNTLLLGGFDRSIDYEILYDYLLKNPVENIVFMGPAGKRMKIEWETKQAARSQKLEVRKWKIEDDMQRIIDFALQNTQKGKICLLSPAAASYDKYSNFEERGKLFKQCVCQPFSLKCYNSFKIDVACEKFICINKDEEFDYVFEKKLFQSPFLILGGGCNILFTKDFQGTVIHINTKGIEIIRQTKDFVTIEVKSGENWDDFIDFCVKNRFFGVENLAGIPGKVGSCPVQNIGAYGVEVKDVIKKVHAIEIDTGKKIELTNKDCKFGYRDSIFKNELKNKAIITSVVFRLAKNESYNLSYKALKDEIEIHPNEVSLSLVQQKVKAIRNRKLPDTEQIGSAGSFFKNPVIQKEKYERLKILYPQLISFEDLDSHVKLAAAQLIEISGWKGFRENDTGVYPFQPLVLVNYGNATGKEIFELSEKIQKSIFENFGILLESEVQVV
ncbi:MAG: UDP-N-acetylmuramate dehydrogenase [Bacteroidales bacterium]|jgi:UDP-N-acetylenolpyruvoylglucosamine reductase|nr:UDP-N-acetylmuramate dehydrogenase [Bacteroidales bacterium]